MPAPVVRQKPAALKPQFRVADFDRASIDSEKRTVTLSFSSETDTVHRYWGTEILGHGDGECDLALLRNRAPLLSHHSRYEQIGVVESATIGTDRKGRAVVRFSKNARADELFRDVVDGIVSKVSVGYRTHEMMLVKEDDEGPTYRVTKWQPFEISLVSVPADDTVGIGRAAADDNQTENPVTLRNQERTNMPPENQPATPPAPAPAIPPATTLSAEERARLAGETRTAELGRMKEIKALAGSLAAAGLPADLAERAIEAGATVEEFRKTCLEEIAKRGGKPLKLADPGDRDVGLSDKEARSFSFCRAILAAADGDWTRAGFEREVMQAASKKFGKDPRGGNRGFIVPGEILRTPLVSIEQGRDMMAGSNPAGGYVVATNLLTSSFVDLLRNRMMLRAMGVTVLNGLTGDVAIPKQTGGATAYWLNEGAEPTESQPSLGQLAMTPKTLGAFVDVTRKLLLQSSIDVEAFVRADMATVMALEIDRVGINGLGASGEPLGILQTAGIGAVSCGTPDGGAPTYEHVIGLETEVAIDNADVGNLGYLTNAKVRGKLKRTQKFSSTNGDPVWEKGAGNGFGELNGYRAGVSNQVPSNLVEGSSGATLSAIVFGNWSDFVVGLWSGLDVLVDPITLGKSGGIRVINHQDLDQVMRHVESFAAAVDAITT